MVEEMVLVGVAAVMMGEKELVKSGEMMDKEVATKEV